METEEQLVYVGHRPQPPQRIQVDVGLDEKLLEWTWQQLPLGHVSHRETAPNGADTKRPRPLALGYRCELMCTDRRSHYWDDSVNLYASVVHRCRTLLQHYCPMLQAWSKASAVPTSSMGWRAKPDTEIAHCLTGYERLISKYLPSWSGQWALCTTDALDGRWQRDSFVFTDDALLSVEWRQIREDKLHLYSWTVNA